jgi:hypothetical protein
MLPRRQPNQVAQCQVHHWSLLIMSWIACSLFLRKEE